MTGSAGGGGASSGTVRLVPDRAREVVDLARPKPVRSRSKPKAGKVGDLGREQGLVPAGVQGELVVGEHVGALLGLAQAGKLDHRHRVKPELPGREQPAMAGDDAVLAVDQDRVGPAERLDGGGDLRDLGGGVGAGIAGVGDQLIQGAVLDREVAARRGRERRALCSELRSTAELVDCSGVIRGCPGCAERFAVFGFAG